MKKIIFLFVLTFGLSGAYAKKAETRSTAERYIQGLSWYQHSAEMRALSYQAFNIAKLRLEMDLKNNTDKKPRAIVLDVDETLVDNSPHAAWAVKNNTGYPNGWKEWISMAKAKALPGAKEFLKWANSKGIEIFYITNRKIAGFDATYKNLKAIGFPVKKENLMLRTTTSSKTERRAKVTEKHRIVLFMGDSMTDFSEKFEKKLSSKRKKIADKYASEFGNRFIVLPNPTYGDWEGALYEYNWKLPNAAKTEKLKIQLKAMK